MIRTAALSSLVALALVGGACAGGDDAADTVAADTATAAAPAPAPMPVDTAAAMPANGLLDPNTASREQIAALPGMTPALADSLVAKRPFNDMRAVDAVLAPSLSEPQRDTIYTRMFKPIDINTASKDEMLLIPGVGNRMQHEFEEYRPYRDIARFRKEIGKYVDSTEVARLERYIRIQ